MEFKATTRFGAHGRQTGVTAYLRILRGICLLLGPCFLLVAIAFAIWEGISRHTGLSAEGTVVSMETRHNARKNFDTFAPVVIFQNAEGRQFKIVGKIASSPPEFTVGDRVPVTYEKERPGAGQIASFRQLWFFPIFFGCFGAAMSGLGALLSLGARCLKKGRLRGSSMPGR